MEGFGDLDGVARAKGEVFSGMPPSAVAVINKDDPRCGVWEQLAKGGPTLGFAMEKDADIRARYRPEHGGSRVQLITPRGEVDLHLAAPGKHNVMNALAATGLALAVDVPLAMIAQGLEAFRPMRGRLLPRTGWRGALILDDTYNANPCSLEAGLDVLVTMPGRHWLVLGDMGELGKNAPGWHEECGRLACGKSIERLITLGPLSAGAGDCFGAGAEHFDDVDALVRRVREGLDADVRVLVKGSRAMRMERVVAGLLGDTDGGKGAD